MAFAGAEKVGYCKGTESGVASVSVASATVASVTVHGRVHTDVSSCLQLAPVTAGQESASDLNQTNVWSVGKVLSYCTNCIELHPPAYCHVLLNQLLMIGQPFQPFMWTNHLDSECRWRPFQEERWGLRDMRQMRFKLCIPEVCRDRFWWVHR